MRGTLSLPTANERASHLVTTAHRNASDVTLREWSEQFHRDGYLFSSEYLTPGLCAELIADRLHSEINGSDR
jgi:hypothetical protein